MKIKRLLNGTNRIFFDKRDKRGIWEGIFLFLSRQYGAAVIRASAGNGHNVPMWSLYRDEVDMINN